MASAPGPGRRFLQRLGQRDGLPGRHPPTSLFHRDYPAAINYGGIGAVMGHGLTHGFDNQGRKYDLRGELREWWEPPAAARFESQAACVRDHYSGYEVQPRVAANGALTLGESIATHAPPRFRVLGAAANTTAFAEAFGCAAGTPMRPARVCEVW